MGQIVSDVTNILDYKKDKKESETARQKILAQIAADEKNKSNLVKKVLASQRAQYGAAGMSGKGMTEEAVLKRLRGETEEPFNEKKRLNLEKFNGTKSGKYNLVKYVLKRIGGISDEFLK